MTRCLFYFNFFGKTYLCHVTREHSFLYNRHITTKGVTDAMTALVMRKPLSIKELLKPLFTKIDDPADPPAEPEEPKGDDTPKWVNNFLEQLKDIVKTPESKDGTTKVPLPKPPPPEEEEEEEEEEPQEPPKKQSFLGWFL